MTDLGQSLQMRSVPVLHHAANSLKADATGKGGGTVKPLRALARSPAKKLVAAKISSDVAAPASTSIRLASSSAARELFTRFDTGHRCKVSSSAGFISAAERFTNKGSASHQGGTGKTIARSGHCLVTPCHRRQGKTVARSHAVCAPLPASAAAGIRHRFASVRPQRLDLRLAWG